MSDQPEGTPAAPLLRVVSGSPTDEELAALLAVLSARAGAEGGADEPARGPSAWSAPSRLMRRPLRPGPDAWRRSALDA